MAATVTANLTDVTLGLDATNWTNTDGTDTEIFIQGTGSESWYVAKNSTPTATFDAYGNNGNATHDMSATDTHLYFWVYSTVAQLVATEANSGLTIKIASDTAQGAATTGTEEWKIAGSDTWDGRWTCFVVDVASTSDTSTGTIDLSAIGTISFYVNSTGTGYRNSTGNYWIDAIRFGTGLTAYGTTFDYGDIATISESTANKYGIIQEIDGVLFVQGKITIDDNAGTTTFNSTSETLAFRDAPVSAGLYKLDFTGTGNTANIQGLSVLSSGVNANTRPAFDASGTVGSFTMQGSAINRGGTVKYKAGQTVTSNRYKDCLQVDPSTSTFNNNIFANSTDTSGAMLWNATTNTHTIQFTNCDKGVEITQTVDQNFVGMDFDDVTAKYDVHLNNGGTSITVNNDQASNANSYIATGGGVVTFASSVTLTMTVKDESGTLISGADASIHESDKTEIMNEQTVSGVASQAFTGGATTGTIWRVRKYGYKPYRATVDIGTADLSIPVTLIVDPQQT